MIKQWQRVVDQNRVKFSYEVSSPVKISKLIACVKYPGVHVEWVEVMVADRLTHMGPYHWFAGVGEMQLHIIENFSLDIVLRVRGDANEVEGVDFFDEDGRFLIAGI